MQNTLHELGVREDTLSTEEKQFLDDNGYLNLGQLLTAEQIQLVRDRIFALLQEEGEQAGAELAESKNIRFPKEAGSDRLADLVNKGPVFDLF